MVIFFGILPLPRRLRFHYCLLFICLYVCLFVSRNMENILNGFPQNLVGWTLLRRRSGQSRSRKVFALSFIVRDCEWFWTQLYRRCNVIMSSSQEIRGIWTFELMRSFKSWTGRLLSRHCSTVGKSTGRQLKHDWVTFISASSCDDCDSFSAF